MTDDALLEAIDALQEEGDEDVGELLKMMNENRIISWEEAERILSDSNTGPVKCSLPPQTRPSEPDNDTDVEQCIRKLQANDPNLTQINLNNMKVGRLEIDENIYRVNPKKPVICVFFGKNY
uniref:Tropomodulin n=1 Tax=Acrobeloides nanus TaxID=290746 RepID=A0A914EE29_9BILA